MYVLPQRRPSSSHPHRQGRTNRKLESVPLRSVHLTLSAILVVIPSKSLHLIYKMSGRKMNMSDEELATALQQQYRLEFLKRQEEKQRRKPTTNTSTATAPPETEVVYNGSSDEAYARRLQQQMDREASSVSYAAAPFTSPVQNVGFENTPGANTDDAAFAMQLQDREVARQYSTNNGNHGNHGNHDIEHQRQRSQELTDAQMAQRLAGLDQEAELRRDREQRSQQSNRSRKCRRLIPLFTLAIAITIPLLFVFGVFTKGDIPFSDGFGSDWVDSDPWSDVGNIDVDEEGNSNIAVGANAIRWSTRNNEGLTLDIQNAMEDKYDQLLVTAVQNWDAGAPIDSLTLNLEKIAYDFECKDKAGVLKVCSGDYGATQWRGLNEVKLNSITKIIVSSTAKMNNYYLQSESEAQKLYTICHELGHGFGLPHWDTDFYNRDLGNCMDYTIRPEQNMKPSESNFQYLAELYGGQSATASAAAIGANTIQEEDKGKGKGKGKDRNRRILHISDKEEVHYIELPEEDMVLIRHYHLN
jgi:hypothetical protein